jgi:hypothetical protein
VWNAAVPARTLKEELQKNRELQDNVKQLQGDVDKLADSEAMKKVVFKRGSQL